MKTNNSRFTLDMTLELRTRVKIAAARRGMSMRQYFISLVEQQLDHEETDVLIPGNFSRESVQKAKDFQRAIFGRRRLAQDSTDLIRQAREERTSR